MAKWQPPHDFSQAARRATGAELKPGQMTLMLPPATERDVAGEAIPPDPLMVGRSSDGKWRCIAHLGFTDSNELVAFRLEVRPWGDDVIGIGTEALRDLPLSRWLVSAHSWLTEPFAAWLKDKGVPTRPIDPESLKQLRRDAKRIADSTPPRPGPKGFGETYYRRLAIDYLELQAKRRDSNQGLRGIRHELARKESTRQKREVRPEHIRDGLTKATALGFLSKGTKGRAGRFAGPNLYPDDQEDNR